MDPDRKGRAAMIILLILCLFVTGALSFVCWHLWQRVLDLERDLSLCEDRLESFEAEVRPAFKSNIHNFRK